MIIASNWKMSMGFHSALGFLNRFKTLVSEKQESGNFIFFLRCVYRLCFKKRIFIGEDKTSLTKAKGL